MKISKQWFRVKFVAVLYAAFAILLGGAPLWAQASTVTTASDLSRGVQPPDASGRPTIVNKYFTYPGIELWNPAKWPKPEAAPIVAWIETHQKPSPPDYVVSAKYKGIKDFAHNPDYSGRKTDSITDPDVIASLARMGLHVEVREAGGVQVVVTPDKVLADKEHKVPIVIVRYVLNKMDAFWAMDTLAHFKKYNELCAQRGDFILVYNVLDKSVAGLGRPITTGGASGGDPKRIYLDVSLFEKKGAKIADVPGLDWTDDNGTKQNPDAEIEHIGFLPVLNIAGKTMVAKPSYELAPKSHEARLGPVYPFNAEAVEHGMLGEHWMEGIRFAYEHGKDNDPALKARFEEMGVVGGAHDYKGKFYLLYSPRQAVEQGTKLPLVVLVQEISRSNPYSISDTYVQYLDYFKLAAEGNINILAVDLTNSPQTEKMDVAYDLIKEAEKTYPIDPSRIYVTGFSHAGYEARDFAYQYPDMVAAVAQLGNDPGYASTAYSSKPVIVDNIVDDQRVAAWSRIDMPDITIGAAGEEMSPHAMPSLNAPDYNVFIDAWQRRLKASRCLVKTRQQIMGAEHSHDYVTRLFGLPNDGSSLQVIDGVEHYIIDIKNIDGRNHLRIVAVQNMFLTAEPTMPMISWSWMRRFARDQKTGEVIELY